MMLSRKEILKCTGFVIFAAMLLISCQPQKGSSTATAPAARAVKEEKPAVQRGSWEEVVALAKKEGAVNIYGAELGAAKDAIRQAFQEKFGIIIDSTQGRPAEILAKLTAERRAGLYLSDVGLIGNSTYVYNIKPMGITVSLENLLVLPEVRDPAKWRNGKIPYLDAEKNSIAIVAMAIPASIFNTNMLKEGDITSFLDYLEPKWKGKIVLSDPAVAGSANNFITLMATQIFGMERTLDILKQLAAQEPFMTRDQRLLIDWVAKGKYPIGIGQSASMFAELKRLGAPIAFSRLKEPPFISSGSGNIFVFDKAPHPNATKLFINWLLSKEGSTVWSPAHGYPSQRLDVSNDSFDPMLLPPAGTAVPDENYLRLQGEMRKTAGDIFASLLK